jgi:hypothetical protein
LFIHTGRSYIFGYTIDWATSYAATFESVWYAFGKCFGLFLLAYILIRVASWLIKVLRNGDIDSDAIVQRVLHSVTGGILGFSLLAVAAYAAMDYFARRVFVSFYGVAQDVELSAMVLETRIAKLGGILHWALILPALLLGLALVAVFAAKDIRKKEKKWLDFALGYGTVVLLFAVIFCIGYARYGSVSRQFAVEKVTSVSLRNIFQEEMNYHDQVHFEPHLWRSEQEKLARINLAKIVAPQATAIRTADGDVHSDMGFGSMQYYKKIYDYGWGHRDDKNRLPVSATDDKYNGAAFCAAVTKFINRDTKKVMEILKTGKPQPVSEHRYALCVDIKMKNGITYTRRCYLTESEVDYLIELLQDAVEIWSPEER